MRSIKHALSVAILVAGCSAVLWPGVFSLPTDVEDSGVSASEAISDSTESVEQLLASLGLEDSDFSEVGDVLAMLGGNEANAGEEGTDAD